MKQVIFILGLCLVFAACKKDVNACKQYREITGRDQGIDAVAFGEQALLDTLAKYPQLQFYSANRNGGGWTAFCHVYYNNLLIFNEEYTLYKAWMNDSIYSADTIFKGALSISLTPAVSYKDAIEAAKRQANFDHTCISYRLGLFNTSSGYAHKPGNYRLVWKVQGQEIYPFVIIDAQNKQVLQNLNGVFDIN